MKRAILLSVSLMGIVIICNAQEKMVPPPPPPKIDYNYNKNGQEFLKKNPTISRYEFKSGSLIILQFKDMTSEQYELTNMEQKKTFEDKYGKAPKAPPPPPPVVAFKQPAPPPPPPTVERVKFAKPAPPPPAPKVKSKQPPPPPPTAERVEFAKPAPPPPAPKVKFKQPPPPPPKTLKES